MPSFNQSRYRYIDWIANRILEATELDKLQQIMHGVAPDGTTKWAWDLGAVYQEGATFNVTPSISATTITLVPTDNTRPMLVFVRGRWEILQTAEAPAVTLTGGQTVLYLNWWLEIRDDSIDPSLVDATNSSPTAQMGELVLAVSATDNSGTSLDTGVNFEQNGAPIALFTFTPGSGTFVLASQAGVDPQALASGSKGGLVKLTTKTSGGVALAADDPAVSNTRTPGALSVADASVRVPVLNGDGSTKPIGTGGGQDAGGISTAKLIHVPTSQLGSVAIEAIRSQANATQTAFGAHASAPLGGGVHVMPTASQVHAAPDTHVGQALGLSTSHPPNVNADSGGFEVIRNPGAASAAMDPAFGVVMAAILQSGLMHNGDVYSALSNAQVAYPGGVDGDGPATTVHLGLLSILANVLANHVNKTSHKNPHGLASTDLGFAVTATANGNIRFGTALGSLMIQWGHTSGIADGNPGTAVVFSPAFTTTCFAVVPVGDFASGGSRIISAANRTRTGFTLRSDGSGEGACWIAIGV